MVKYILKKGKYSGEKRKKPDIPAFDLMLYSDGNYYAAVPGIETGYSPGIVYIN